MAAITTMSSVASACKTSIASSAVTTPIRRLSPSTTGSSSRSYSCISWAASSWSSWGWTVAKGWDITVSSRAPPRVSSSVRRLTSPSRV